MTLLLLEYAGLFLSAFLSATFVPLQSELAFVGMVISGRYPAWLLLAVAGAGNTLGSAVNWWLGRALTRFENRRWFPIRKSAIERAEKWYVRYGLWSLLFSWMPVIGDPLTLAAGIMRTDFRIFLALVAVAKTGRYAMVLWMAGPA